MYNVLLIEDSADYQFLVPRTLGSQFAVHVAATLEQARIMLKKPAYDLILLDVLLPDGDGYSFCSEIQGHKLLRAIPVVILTGKGDVNDKVVGWTTGADDYIVKPFNPIEFQSRILSRVTKSRSRAEDHQTLSCGDLVLSLNFHECKVIENGEEKTLHLTVHEFKILQCLLKNPDRIHSREQLIEKVWGLNTHITQRTVDKHISALRQKLGPDRNFIRTIAGVGYRIETVRAA